MKLIAPTAFKGTMTPVEAARYLASSGDLLLPLSDGGDGFIECFKNKFGGFMSEIPAADPYGHIRPVPILELPDGTVVVECAKVIGMAGLKKLNPLEASSKGLGGLLARLQGAPKLFIGLGGSATVDGGMDWPHFTMPPSTVFCDVKTDLADAVALYAPQKGALPEDLPVLNERLMRLGLPRGIHTGAAGGLGAKLKSLGAELVDGAQAMLEILEFDSNCLVCDAVVTGEGRLDESTLEGKLPFVVAKRARSLGKMVIGHFGSKGEGWEKAAVYFDEVRFEEPIC